MKIGLFIILYRDQPLEKVLDKMVELGIEAVEIGAGAYSRSPHCPLDELLANPAALRRFSKAFADRGLEISALNTTGNPLHPNRKIQNRHRADINKTILLAERLGVERVVTMSGCPGESDRAKNPYWSICIWPEEFNRVLAWQWREKIIPYWRQQVKFSRKHHVRKIALEMHPGMSVYNPESLIKLREATGEEIGANFDPSHLFWQGIDPLRAIRRLGQAIYHVHAKDTQVEAVNAELNGVLDPKPYTLAYASGRSWLFRTVGYGHGIDFWKRFVSTLQMVGYDHVLSIEHEDLLMSTDEGVSKSVEFLQQVILREKVGIAPFEASRA